MKRIHMVKQALKTSVKRSLPSPRLEMVKSADDLHRMDLDLVACGGERVHGTALVGLDEFQQGLGARSLAALPKSFLFGGRVVQPALRALQPHAGKAERQGCRD